MTIAEWKGDIRVGSFSYKRVANEISLEEIQWRDWSEGYSAKTVVVQ